MSNMKYHVPKPSAFDILMMKDKIPKKEAEPDYYVYTDGACANNGTEYATSGFGIYFGESDARNISQKILGKQSNNIAELTAIIEAYYIIEKDLTAGKKICIVSDSLYAIRSATTYGKKCSDSGWVKDIPNKELVKKAFELYYNNPHVSLMHVAAHTDKTDKHSLGNYGADKLANKAIGLEECPYNNTHKKLYIIVPFVKKEIIKKMGGKWDPSVKCWYIYDDSVNKEDVLTIFDKLNN